MSDKIDTNAVREAPHADSLHRRMAAELDRLYEIERCVRGVVLTCHPSKIQDAVVQTWWDALARAMDPPAFAHDEGCRARGCWAGRDEPCNA